MSVQNSIVPPPIYTPGNLTKQFGNLTLDVNRKFAPPPLIWDPPKLIGISNVPPPSAAFNNPYPAQENVGGTTYFYPSPNANPTTSTTDPGYALLEASLEENNACNELVIIIIFFLHTRILNFLM